MKGTLGRTAAPLHTSIEVDGRIIRDDGMGNLCGDGAGRIDYDTGDWEFNFNKPKPKGKFTRDWSVGDTLFIPVDRVNHIDVSEWSTGYAMRLLSDHKCPACGGKTLLMDADSFGSVKVACQKHGQFSLQRG